MLEVRKMSLRLVRNLIKVPLPGKGGAGAVQVQVHNAFIKLPENVTARVRLTRNRDHHCLDKRLSMKSE